MVLGVVLIGGAKVEPLIEIAGYGPDRRGLNPPTSIKNSDFF